MLQCFCSELVHYYPSPPSRSAYSAIQLLVVGNALISATKVSHDKMDVSLAHSVINFCKLVARRISRPINRQNVNHNFFMRNDLKGKR